MSELLFQWVGRQGFDVRLAAPAAAQALRALARSLRMLRIRFTLAPPMGFEPMGCVQNRKTSRVARFISKRVGR